MLLGTHEVYKHLIEKYKNIPELELIKGGIMEGRLISARYRQQTE